MTPLAPPPSRRVSAPIHLPRFTGEDAMSSSSPAKRGRWRDAKHRVGGGAVAALATLFFALAPAAHADMPANWSKPTKPYRVVGNIYYVGTEGISSWLITSSEGHVLLDGGPNAEVGKQIERNIASLGFKLTDVKILINTHAHYDHAGGLAQLKADIPGAKLWISRGDEPAIEQGHHIGDNENGPTPMPAVKVDKSFGDNQKLKLGETAMVAHLTPGHTIGCTSWTTAVIEKGRPLNVTFPCSLSVAGNVLVGNKEHRTIVADYRESFAKLRAIPTDVMLPAHEEQGNLLAKRQKQLRGDPNAFVDPTELSRFVDASESAFNKELARQQAAGASR